MSIKVKSLDENSAKQEVKKCNITVRNYVKALQNVIEANKQFSSKAIVKIREQEAELIKFRQDAVIKSVCVHENIEVILPIKRCLKCQHIEEWKPKQTVL
jgi:hypothetical protein